MLLITLIVRQRNVENHPPPSSLSPIFETLNSLKEEAFHTQTHTCRCAQQQKTNDLERYVNENHTKANLQGSFEAANDWLKQNTLWTLLLYWPATVSVAAFCLKYTVKTSNVKGMKRWDLYWSIIMTDWHCHWQIEMLCCGESVLFTPRLWLYCWVNRLWPDCFTV